MQNIYSYQSVEQFINDKLIPEGYEIVIIPGALVDSYICIAPDERHYHFIFREQYLNEWSSGLTKRRCKKLTKWALDAIAEFDEQEEAIA